MPGRIFQQNHVGVFRSDDHGERWTAIHAGLPNPFGFGLALHPRDPDTCFVIPLQPSEGTFRATEGALRVYRRSKSGWTALDRGLPTEGAFVNVLREGMSSDPLGGVYFGTGGGHVFASRDEGRSWKPLALYLPPVLSVSAAVL